MISAYIKGPGGPRVHVAATVDSGASRSVVGRPLAEAAGAKLVTEHVRAEDFMKRRVPGSIREMYVRSDPYRCSAIVRAFVPDRPNGSVLLGADFLQAIGGRLDFVSDYIECRPGTAAKIADGAPDKVVKVRLRRPKRRAPPRR